MKKITSFNNILKTYRAFSIGILIILLFLCFQHPVFAAPGPEHLAETMECEFTSDLTTLAGELENDPVKIFNWVRKNINLDKYYTESRMGANTTYFNRRGNQWDISSLMVALLRISGVPARYAYNSLSGEVFVEAWLPLDNYRGGGDSDTEGWIPLVPWFKNSTIKEGLNLFPDDAVPAGLEFDFENYLTSTNYKTPLELFEEKVQNYLNTNYDGKSLKDVPFIETENLKNTSILPGSFPGNVNNSGSISYFSEIPYEHRQSITLTFLHDNGSTLLTRKIYLPQIAGKRFYLDFIPASSSDQSIINSYNGMCYTPSEANAYVKPVLKINGVIMPQVIIDGVTIPEAIGSSIKLRDSFYLKYTGGGFSNITRDPRRLAGTFMQMAFDPLSASAKTIEKTKKELETRTTDEAYIDNTREEILGRMANILTETFLLRLHESASRVEDLVYGKFSWDSLSPTFIFTFPANMQKDKESKFFIHPQWQIDAQSLTGFYKRDNSGNMVFMEWSNPVFTLARKLSGYSASYNEGRIFEDWLDTQGLSTVKGLMVAYEDPDIEVRELKNITADINLLNSLKYRENFDWNTLTTAQWDALLNQFAIEQGIATPLTQAQKDQFKTNFINGTWSIYAVDHILVDLGLIPANALDDAVIQNIINMLAQYNSVTAPLQQIDYKGMKGYVMLGHSDNGSIGDSYLFNMDNGVDNGGMASSWVETNDDYELYTLSLATGIPTEDIAAFQSEFTTTINGEQVIVLPEIETVGASTYSLGDPVNMVKGEFYQEEKPDFNIISRGFPLSVLRKYKNQLIYNGPFGYGWTWNHAQRIVPLDGDDLYYYDNEGTPYKLESNGDGTYQYPPGSMFVVNKTTEGSNTIYILTQKRSNNKFFFTVEGYIYKKEDRFGNTLTFSYENTNYPNRITKITDSLNRSLTLAYNPNGKVDTITDFTGRQTIYDYTGDDLTTFTDLEGNDTEYEYLSGQESELNNHNMSKYTLPEGDYLEIGYYKNDTVAYHRNAKGETFNFQYSRLNRYGETWNEEGYYRKVFFNDNNDVIRVANEDGTIEQMDWDDHHNKTSHTDANGNTTYFQYYPDGDQSKEVDGNLYSKKMMADGEWLEITYKYDDANNLYAPSEITDPEGNITEIEYNADGSVDKKIHAPDFAYHSDGRLISSPGAPGFVTDYTYDQYGNVTSIQDPIDAVTMVYDTDGLYLESSTDKNGYVTTYKYYKSGSENPVGLLESVTINSPEDAGGITTSYTYNQYNQKTSVLDDLGNKVIYEYDGNRKLLSKTLPNGAVTDYYYDTARDIVSGAKLLEMEDPLGGIVYYKYDKLGNLTHKKDKNGNEIKYFYDGLNRLIEQIDPFQNSISISYDGNGNVVSKVDRNGNETTITYDEANRKTSITDPEGNIFTYTYYRDGKLETETHTVNKGASLVSVTTYYQYNALGQLETKTIGYGSGDTRVFKYRYNALSQLTKSILPEGNYTTIEYDDNGNKRFVRNFDSSDVQVRQVEYVYYTDSRNLLKEKIVDNGKNGSGEGYEYEYDTIGRLRFEYDPEGNYVEYQYDSVGNIIVEIDGAGNVTKHFYDQLNRKTKTIDAANNILTYQYDNNSNLTSVTDREGNVTATYYDVLNRKIGVEDALGAITTFDYDANSNLVALTDPNNGTTRYQYDGNNQQIKLIRPLGEETTFDYDAVGNRVEILDAKNQKITYDYDQFGLLEDTSYYSSTNHTTPVKTVNFTYYDNGNLESYNDGTTSATYTYDALSRKLGETVNFGSFPKNFSYAYPNNWQSTFTGPDNITLTYNYDASYRLNSIVIPGQSPVTYDEYNWNRPTEVTLPDGSTHSFTYDPLLRLDSITATDSGSSTIMTRTYDYSPEGNIDQKISEHGTYIYGYDDMYRLTSADNPTLANEGYTYDDLGNRITSDAVPGNWAYNRNNEIDSYSDVTFSHDNNGNLTDKYVGTDHTEYIYDEGDRLVEVKENGSTVATYYYDPFGRRISKEYGGEKTYYLYSDEGLIGEYDSTGTVKKTYGYLLGGQWTTAPLFQKIGSSYYYYHNDHLGTPQKITNSSGAVVWSATYDSFGNVQIITETITNNLRFPGQYYDDETGMYYNFNRYYDPEIGRYLRTDPAFDGLNLYAYVYNNPLYFIDPYGLMSIEDYEQLHRDNAMTWGDLGRVAEGLSDLGDEKLESFVDNNPSLWPVGATAATIKEFIEPDYSILYFEENIINGDYVSAGTSIIGVVGGKKLDAVTEHLPGSVQNKIDDALESEVTLLPGPSRPSPRQSEIDIGDEYGWPAQQSYKEGRPTTYGNEGSVRPDLSNSTYNIHLDIKNYDLSSSSNRANLYNTVGQQARERAQNLPSGSHQGIVIDIRGQNIDPAVLNRIPTNIETATDGIIPSSSVVFKQ